MSHPREESFKFRSIIENIKTGILFTNCGNDELTGRPMFTIRVDLNCSLWFFTNEFSNHVNQIWENNEVYINYANPYLNTYAIVKGKAYLTRDINKINELYIPSVNEWSREGINDPGLLLIRVEPANVEYWNGNNGKIVSSFNMLASNSSNRETYKDYKIKRAELSSF